MVEDIDYNEIYIYFVSRLACSCFPTVYGIDVYFKPSGSNQSWFIIAGGKLGYPG